MKKYLAIMYFIGFVSLGLSFTPVSMPNTYLSFGILFLLIASFVLFFEVVFNLAKKYTFESDKMRDKTLKDLDNAKKMMVEVSRFITAKIEAMYKDHKLFLSLFDEAINEAGLENYDEETKKKVHKAFSVASRKFYDYWKDNDGVSNEQ
jgi:hypothetical protein